MSDTSLATQALHSNPFRTNLHAGKLVYSLAPFVVPSYSVGQLAANAGFDALFIDMEHSMVGFDKASEICAGALGAG